MNVNEMNQEAVPVAVGITYLTFLSALAPEVVLGAFAGSVIFLLGATNKPKWQWVLYFIVAFLVGLLGAHTVAKVVSELLSMVRITAEVPEGFGALIAAACIINMLGWFRDNPTYLWTRKSGDQTK
ncbi:putative holin [Dyella sp. ASV21]|uniref:putative holin n=1 Tax=Dyella sp. ASV21 TaxID=2795114 RepID=UPI0018ED977F|nr:putative holin [Dyella sp. ASV21]